MEGNGSYKAKPPEGAEQEPLNDEMIASWIHYISTERGPCPDKFPTKLALPLLLEIQRRRAQPTGER